MARLSLLGLTVSGVLMAAHAGRAADGDPPPCNSLCQSWMQFGSPAPERAAESSRIEAAKPAPDLPSPAAEAKVTPPRLVVPKIEAKRQARTVARVAKGDAPAPRHAPVPAAAALPPMRRDVAAASATLHDDATATTAAAHPIVVPLPPDVPPADVSVVARAEPIRQPEPVAEFVILPVPTSQPVARPEPIVPGAAQPSAMAIALSTPAPDAELAPPVIPVPGKSEQRTLAGPPPFDVIGALLLQPVAPALARH